MKDTISTLEDYLSVMSDEFSTALVIASLKALLLNFVLTVVFKMIHLLSKLIIIER